MKKITIWIFLLALASAVPLLAQVTFTASPNPLPVGVTATTLTWNAPSSTGIDIHLTTASGPLMASVANSGSLPVSASWVVPGVTFFLVDHNTGVTLATLTLTSVATITLTPNPLPTGVTSVTVSWNATGTTDLMDIREGSASGTVFQSAQPPTGSAVASGVVAGESFYLVDHASGVALASVYILGGWNFPVANQSQCLPFPVLLPSATQAPQGYATCWRVGYYPWYAIAGLGWTTGFTLTNPTSSDMPIQIAVADKNGNQYAPSSVTVNGSPVTLASNATDARILPANGVLRYVFPNTGGGEIDGQIYLQVLAKDGLSLNTIQAVEDFSLTTSGITYSTVTLPISWVDLATTTYSSLFEESSTDSSLGSFAIKDMSGSAQSVDVKVFDVNGNQLGDHSVPLAANQTAGFTADQLFGKSTFSSLTPVPIVRIQFTGTGPIAVLLLQVRGQTESSIPVQQVLEH